MHQEPAEAFPTVIQGKYSFIGRRSTNGSRFYRRKNLKPAKCIRCCKPSRLIDDYQSSVVFRFRQLIGLRWDRGSLLERASLAIISGLLLQWEKSFSHLLVGDSRLPTFPGFAFAKPFSRVGAATAPILPCDRVRARISMRCTHWHRLANPGAISTSLLVRSFTQSDEVNHYLTQFYLRALMRLEE